MPESNQDLIVDFVERARRAQAAVDREIARSMSNHPAGSQLCRGKHCDEHAPPRPRGVIFKEVN